MSSQKEKRRGRVVRSEPTSPKAPAFQLQEASGRWTSPSPRRSTGRSNRNRCWCFERGLGSATVVRPRPILDKGYSEKKSVQIERLELLRRSVRQRSQRLDLDLSAQPSPATRNENRGTNRSRSCSAQIGKAGNTSQFRASNKTMCAFRPSFVLTPSRSSPPS